MKKNTIKSRRKPHSPYTHINWEKASLLFKSSAGENKNKSVYPQVKEVLRILAAVGAVGMVFAFPGAAIGIGSIMLGKNSYSRWSTKKIVDQLARQKYVKVKENVDGTTTLYITKRGMTKALTYQLDLMKLTKAKYWDKKWRVVIFDIPDKYKYIRDIFRMRLVQLGLHKLQESVYVSPFRCFDEVEFLRELYGVAFTVRYLLVDRIEDDSFLKQYFHLS